MSARPQPQTTPPLEPDVGQLEIFINAIFKHAGDAGVVSVRSFPESDRGPPSRISHADLRGGLTFLLEVAEDDARRAAQHPQPTVFCPPLAVFNTKDTAREEDLARGLVLTVECDAAAQQALATLTALIGAPTLVSASGGEWLNPETGALEPKLHLHWRLTAPTTTPETHALLKEARGLAGRLVGGDMSSWPVVHPLRWPGSWHRKSTPKLATVVSVTENEIVLDDVLALLREAVGTVDYTEDDGFSATGKLDDQGAVAAALNVIPNTDLDWATWNKIGMACWRATEGSEEGRVAFAAWSAKSNKNDARKTNARWRHYRTSPPQRIGFGTLYYLARLAVPDWTYGKRERDAKVAEINATYALVLAGNKAAVMKFEGGATKFRLLQVGGFKTWFANQLVPVGKKMVALGDYWLTHKQRRQFEGIEFEPPGGTPQPGFYNLWQGFAVKPSPTGSCQLFLDHIRDNVARGDDYTYNWIVGWWAQIYQQPTIKMETALVLRGQQGTGKTKIGLHMGDLVGEHYLPVSSSRYITGQFNSHMASLLVLHAEEAFWAGDKKGESIIKDLVSGIWHLLEYKGVDQIRVKNRIRLFVTGNPGWLVPAGLKERRFAVFDMGEAHLQDHAYFAAIDAQMANGGREALLYHLLNFKLDTVNLRQIPKTAALLEQQIESLPAEEAWWLDTLMRGVLPVIRIDRQDRNGRPSYQDFCTKEVVHQSYVKHAQLQGIPRRSTETKLAIFLKAQFGTELGSTRPLVNGEQAACHVFPPLVDCRRLFAQKLGQALDWGAAGWETDEWQFRPPQVF